METADDTDGRGFFGPSLGESELVGDDFEDLADDWVCPLCGVGKDQFEEQ